MKPIIAKSPSNVTNKSAHQQHLPHIHFIHSYAFCCLRSLVQHRYSAALLKLLSNWYCVTSGTWWDLIHSGDKSLSFSQFVYPATGHPSWLFSSYHNIQLFIYFFNEYEWVFRICNICRLCRLWCSSARHIFILVSEFINSFQYYADWALGLFSRLSSTISMLKCVGAIWK